MDPDSEATQLTLKIFEEFKENQMTIPQGLNYYKLENHLLTKLSTTASKPKGNVANRKVLIRGRNAIKGNSEKWSVYSEASKKRIH